MHIHNTQHIETHTSRPNNNSSTHSTAALSTCCNHHRTASHSYPIHIVTCFQLLCLLLCLFSWLVCVSATITIYASWIPAALDTPPPNGRCDQFLTAVSSPISLWLFGGMTSAGPVNDVWSGQLTPLGSIAWQQMQYSGTSQQAPSPRYALAGTTINTLIDANTTHSYPLSTIFLYGGLGSSGQFLDDVNAYVSDPVSPYWNPPVRVLSSQRTSTSAPVDIHTLQPSARAWTGWHVSALNYQALRSIPHSLQTAGLLQYLNVTASLPGNSSITAFVLFGGRSDPTTAYSTDSTNQPIPAFGLETNSPLNRDYADLWFYIPTLSTTTNTAAITDLWIRVGNATCTAQSYVCIDFQTLNNLTGSALLENLNEMSVLAVTFVRPSNLTSTAAQLLGLTLQTNSILQGVWNEIQANPNLTINAVNGCAYECTDPLEPPSISDNTGDGCYGSPYICNNVTGGTGTIFAVGVRPDSVEGHASDVLIVAADGSSLGTIPTPTSGKSYYWQFGGFTCASGAGAIVTVSTWSSSCFSQTLSVLDLSAMQWTSYLPPTNPTLAQAELWPSRRVYAAMAIDQLKQQLWLYGGTALSGFTWQYFNDLYLFDIPSLSWAIVSLSLGGGISPTAVRSASLVLMPPPTGSTAGATLYLFGGCDASNFYNQLVILQTASSLTAANWLLTGNVDTVSAGTPVILTITAELILNNGSFGHQLTYATGLATYFSVLLYEAGTNQLSLSTVVNEVGNGQYSLNFSISASASFDLYIRFGQGGTAQLNIPNTPVTFHVYPGLYEADHTMLISTNYTTVEKFSDAVLILQLEDAYDNAETSSAPKSQEPSFSLYYSPTLPSFSTTSSTGNSTIDSLSSLPVTTVDNGDGTYTLTYTAPSYSTFYLYILVNGIPISGSPFVISALDPITLPDDVRVAFLVISVLLAAFVLFITAFVIVERHNPVLRASSPLFLCLVCLGALLCIISVPIFAYLSDVTCRLFPFMLTTGYILALSAMFTKSYRVLLIFGSHKLESQELTDTTMLLPVLIMLMMETVVNLVWLITSPLSLQTVSVSGGVQQYQQCGGSHATAFIAASVVFNGLIAGLGVYIAVKIRNVPEAFNESKLMGAALYNLALCMIISIPLTWTATNTSTSHEDFLVPAPVILWCATMTVALVVAPKLYYVVYPPDASFFDACPASGMMVKGVKGRAPARNSKEEDDGQHTHTASTDTLNGKHLIDSNTTGKRSSWSVQRGTPLKSDTPQPQPSESELMRVSVQGYCSSSETHRSPSMPDSASIGVSPHSHAPISANLHMTNTTSPSPV